MSECRCSHVRPVHLLSPSGVRGAATTSAFEIVTGVGVDAEPQPHKIRSRAPLVWRPIPRTACTFRSLGTLLP